jgi:hypothetical protein
MKLITLILLVSLHFSSTMIAGIDEKGETKDQRYVEKIFDRYIIVMDSLCQQISNSAVDIPMGISNIVVYKVHVKWMLEEELENNEVQFLNSYFENKIKLSVSRSKRISVFSGHDLRPLYIKASDSSLQIKNVYSEEQLRKYALAHNIQAILSAEILITENRVTTFLELNDLNATTIWNHEIQRTVTDMYIPTEADKLKSEYMLKKSTGLEANDITVSFLSTKVKNGSQFVDAKKFPFVSVGYRFNDVATIIDPVNFFIDSRIFYNPRCTSHGLMVTPGFGFDILSSQTIGRRLITLNFAGGYYYQIDVKRFTPAYHVSLSLRMSRIIGVSFDTYSITDENIVESVYPSGFIFGGSLNFYL